MCAYAQQAAVDSGYWRINVFLTGAGKEVEGMEKGMKQLGNAVGRSPPVVIPARSHSLSGQAARVRGICTQLCSHEKPPSAPDKNCWMSVFWKSLWCQSQPFYRQLPKHQERAMCGENPEYSRGIWHQRANGASEGSSGPMGHRGQCWFLWLRPKSASGFSLFALEKEEIPWWHRWQCHSLWKSP